MRWLDKLRPGKACLTPSVPGLSSRFNTILFIATSFFYIAAIGNMQSLRISLTGRGTVYADVTLITSANMIFQGQAVMIGRHGSSAPKTFFSPSSPEPATFTNIHPLHSLAKITALVVLNRQGHAIPNHQKWSQHDGSRFGSGTMLQC